MQLTINHTTRYTFDNDVALEPHIVRLRPRDEPGVRLIRFALSVVPTPVVWSDHLDAHDNCVSALWFDGTTRSLTVNATATVDRREINPFAFLPEAGLASGNGGYAPDVAALAAYRQHPDHVDRTVAAWARELADPVPLRPDQFAAALVSRLHDDMSPELREEGEPRSPEETLSLGRGSCRDVAVLFVACCRAVGLAARFVSGYAYDDDTDAQPELHAWGEVYLPGGGWRGFDATDGLAVSQRHVALAAAARATDTAPVSGSFRSHTSATVTLDTALDIRATSHQS